MSDYTQRPENSSTNESPVDQKVSLDSLSTEDFLRVVGLRVRAQRSAMSMSRKRLAEVSGVSERYLAQLESGQGNMSIALLRKVTSAIDMSLATLLCADTPELESAADPAVATAAKPVTGSQDSPLSSGVNPYKASNDSHKNAHKLVTEL